MSFTPKDIAHVSKFHGHNYPFWKFQLSIVLKQFYLLDIANGKDKKPDLVSAVGVSNDFLIKAWVKRDLTASSCIVVTLEEKIQRSLFTCQT